MLLGLLCFRQDETDEALAQLQHALYLEPDAPLAHFYLGNIYQQRGQFDNALRAYRSAARTARNFQPAWDSGFTPEVLVRVCERSVARLEKRATEDLP